MTSIYLIEPGLKLSKNGGYFIIERDTEVVMEVPIEVVEDITVARTVQLSSIVISEALKREIPITWISASGYVEGTLLNISSFHVNRQQRQFDLLHDKEFCLTLCRSFLCAKIYNQSTFLNKQAKTANVNVDVEMQYFKNMTTHIETATDICQIMGYEGFSSKLYFQGLGKTFPEGFTMVTRSRRPPKDPINALLSFGYSCLFNTMLTAILQVGLNPYVSVLHSLRKNHPALASDLMEEWRVPMIDRLINSLIRKKQVTPKMFAKNGLGCFMTKEAKKLFINAYNKKLLSTNSYLGTTYTYREAIMKQCKNYALTLKEGDPTLYKPIRIR